MTRTFLAIVLFLNSAICIYSSSPQHTTNQQIATVDPWLFDQRLDLYMRLLNASQYAPLFGDDNKGNIFWGLPLQLEWQMKTGRLLNNQTNRIKGTSWWGCMNYYLSVLPYMGAVSVGFAPAVEFLPPPDNNNVFQFCRSIDQCANQTSVQKWGTYWTAVVALQSGTKNYSLDALTGILWDAHTETVNQATPTFNYLLEVGLPSHQEVKFVLGWVCFVPILGSVRFTTNYSTVFVQETYLPFRMLRANDEPGFIKDMSDQMNAAIALQFAMYDAHETPMWTLFMNDWSRSMETEKCRAAAREMLVTLLNHPVGAMFKLLWSFATEGCV